MKTLKTGKNNIICSWNERNKIFFKTISPDGYVLNPTITKIIPSSPIFLFLSWNYGQTWTRTGVISHSSLQPLLRESWNFRMDYRRQSTKANNHDTTDHPPPNARAISRSNPHINSHVRLKMVDLFPLIDTETNTENSGICSNASWSISARSSLWASASISAWSGMIWTACLVWFDFGKRIYRLYSWSICLGR